MLRALTGLIGCQFAGEVIARVSGIPLPGPVVGLVLLLILLIARGGPGPEMRDTANGLLRYLSLLFVPAGVAIITQLDALERDWLPILVAIVASTVVSLVVTGWLMQRLLKGPDQ